ncbi:YjzD family protein [Peribacillus muralis]|uniref:YjzD family protein n=1 Tax=Peribacillus muralis TaxID=264697 RepID=UPI001F4D5DDA|nr:YjzD family protein [Peribacillus muralis]MCK1992863.1 YjzD family protein [Peribacillus muralis]MCK2013418.1 YjzD family protein [Peribacillus muralis]
MRYAWAIFWTFILVHMTVYVVSSMMGVSYDAAQGTILGIAASILILIIPAVLPAGPTEDTQQH